MNTRWLVLLASLVLVAIGAVMAQDDEGKVNDPGFNERANACFAGGSLEGKCHTTDADRDGDIDQLDVDFMWWCGWYIIRVEYKQLPASVVPNGCYFEPAPPPTPTAAPTETPIDDDCPPFDDAIPMALPMVRPLFSNEIVDPCDDYWWDDEYWYD